MLRLLQFYRPHSGISKMFRVFCDPPTVYLPQNFVIPAAAMFYTWGADLRGTGIMSDFTERR